MKGYQVVFPAAALVLGVISAPAHAASGCSPATLKGSYTFVAHGAVLGIIAATSSVVASLHAFATPQPLDDVAIIDFDGVNGIKRIDFAMIDGSPRGGQSSFSTDQTGSYQVFANCTGQMTINYPGANGGTTLQLKMVVSDDGKIVDALIVSETVPGSAAAADGARCVTDGCVVGVQVSMQGKKMASGH